MESLYSGLFILCAGLLVVALSACSEQPRSQELFERLPPEHTGIEFANDLEPSENLSIANWPYFYNGAGVAVGDITGNGRIDLYFTANQESNRLYLNEGEFRFRDVAEAAGVGGSADWSNGVTMVDMNGDGRLDIYVSVVDGYLDLEGHNELYINQGINEEGIPQFKERAAAYGLDHRGYGIQALFFDYDGDGDLDMYQMNGMGNRPRRLPPSRLRLKKHEKIGDRLYRNDDSVFVDVTVQAGIYGGPTGAGLGVVSHDFDQNECPDLYVANDFFEHDYLYYNDCDGTFTESIDSATGHVSYSSMGVDAADYNNDGRPDLAVLDMLPFKEDVLKTTEPPDDERTYRSRRRYGYHHQLDRNTLQLNQGNRHFSEIGLLANVAATDWSWATLFADFNNTGTKDLFVTNGIYRRPNDLDYFEYALQKGRLQELEEDSDSEPYRELSKRMPQSPSSNFVFHNNGDLTFSDSTETWGLGRSGFSNGAAYADLDNDGSLDLIVNNVNEPASIYENRADTLRDHHYLKVKLKGEGENTQGLGAEVTVYQKEQTQLRRQQVTRGYQSSVDPRLHFGLETGSVDSLTVVWPDGRTETRGEVASNQMITLRQAEAGTRDAPSVASSQKSLVNTTPADSVGIDFQHEENASYNELQYEPLMPRRLSTEGPALAAGDITGNGLDDVYLGGASGQPSALCVQRPNGQFRRATENERVWRADREKEDVDAAFFDATGNGALDLYVVSGGNQFSGKDEALRDRLYLNDGTGKFRKSEERLPGEMMANGAVVAPEDFDGDGDVDLFVGSRAMAEDYGRTPPSYLLENDGSGTFTDVTDSVAPELRNVGMVTDAEWTDVRGSDSPDLVVVGEWMPITVFEQQEDRLIDRTQAAGLSETTGWWSAVHAADLTGDGATDLIAGNFGRNSRIRPAPDRPVRLYLDDFNEDDQPEPILTRYNDGAHHLWARRDELIREFPSFEEKFPTYESFGARQIEDIFSSSEIRAATMKEAQTFASVYAENQADTTFTVEDLPPRAQFSPVYGILTHDIDEDSTREVMLGGNFHGVRPRQGRYDAGYGTLLQGSEKGDWSAMAPFQSNLYLRGEVRELRLLRSRGGMSMILVGRNDGQPLVVSFPEISKE